MTEQTQGKVAQLTPEEWKNLVLLNIAQLQNYLQSVPGNGETGASGLSADHLKLVDTHLARGRGFMRAWALSKLDIAPPAVVQPQAQAVGATNGAGKKTGGWPKGKKRTRTPAAAEAQ